MFDKYAPGTEIYAIYTRSKANPDVVYVFGKGKIVSKEIPPKGTISKISGIDMHEAGMECHKFEMDNGFTIWSTYCDYWGDVDSVMSMIEHLKIIEITPDDMEEIDNLESTAINM